MSSICALLLFVPVVSFLTRFVRVLGAPAKGSSVIGSAGSGRRSCAREWLARSCVCGSGGARPDEVQVKFGLKFTAAGNVILAGASGEATLEISLTYGSSGGPGPLLQP